MTTIRETFGPEFTVRYNLYRAAQVNGSAAPGYFCAYAVNEANVVLNDVSNPATGGFGAGDDGAQIVLAVLGTEPAFDYGTWAVTAR